MNLAFEGGHATELDFGCVPFFIDLSFQHCILPLPIPNKETLTLRLLEIK
jgi:hypothetical protein